MSFLSFCTSCEITTPQSVSLKNLMTQTLFRYLNNLQSLTLSLYMITLFKQRIAVRSNLKQSSLSLISNDWDRRPPSKHTRTHICCGSMSMRPAEAPNPTSVDSRNTPRCTFKRTQIRTLNPALSIWRSFYKTSQLIQQRFVYRSRPSLTQATLFY